MDESSRMSVNLGLRRRSRDKIGKGMWLNSSGRGDCPMRGGIFKSFLPSKQSESSRERGKRILVCREEMESISLTSSFAG